MRYINIITVNVILKKSDQKLYLFPLKITRLHFFPNANACYHVDIRHGSTAVDRQYRTDLNLILL